MSSRATQPGVVRKWVLIRCVAVLESRLPKHVRKSPGHIGCRKRPDEPRARILLVLRDP